MPSIPHYYENPNSILCFFETCVLFLNTLPRTLASKSNHQSYTLQFLDWSKPAAPYFYFGLYAFHWVTFATTALMPLLRQRLACCCGRELQLVSFTEDGNNAKKAWWYASWADKKSDIGVRTTRLWQWKWALEHKRLEVLMENILTWSYRKASTISWVRRRA